MKIVISGLAAAYELDTELPIHDPERLRKLDGLDFDKDKCSNYLDRDLKEIGIEGGIIRLAFDAKAKKLRVITEYVCSRRLKPAEVKRLVDETRGQWSDGIGEGQFRHRKKLKMDVSISSFGASTVKVQQIDDGSVAAAPRIVPLIKAQRDGKVELAKKLLDEGAKVNYKDQEGSTPLQVACLYGQFELAIQMLEMGANASAADKERATPLALLSRANIPEDRREASVKAAKALLAKGAKVDARDKVGRTPLMWAVNRRNIPLIRFLIANGADVNAQDKEPDNESTVLMYAQRLEIAQILLDHGADPSIRNASEETAWEYALVNDHIPGIRKVAALMKTHAQKPKRKK